MKIIIVCTREIETQEQLEKTMFKLMHESKMPERCKKALGLKSGPVKWTARTSSGEENYACEIIDPNNEVVGAA